MALMTGILEPLHFTYLFAAPILWIAYGFIGGVTDAVLYVLGSRAAINNGIIDALVMNSVFDVSLTKIYIPMIVGIIMTVAMYFTFVFLIVITLFVVLFYLGCINLFLINLFFKLGNVLTSCKGTVSRYVTAGSWSSTGVGNIFFQRATLTQKSKWRATHSTVNQKMKYIVPNEENIIYYL